jgi:DNA-directed RNA polymerase subunit N (RpoN/RPB10)
MDELESYNQEFKKRLDEIGALGDIPDDLALEVMFCSRVLYFYSSGIVFSNKQLFL